MYLITSSHYDAGIIYLDDQIGALMKMLDDQGLS